MARRRATKESVDVAGLLAAIHRDVSKNPTEWVIDLGPRHYDALKSAFDPDGRLFGAEVRVRASTGWVSWTGIPYG